MIYPDTSFLVPLYTNEPFTEEANGFMAANAQPVIFTPFHRLEFRTALRVRAYQQRMSGEKLREALRRSDEDVEGGYLKHTPHVWQDALREAERLAEAHLAVVGARSGVLLHVASAVVFGARDFLTFDERQTALARRAGLKVRGIRRR